MEDSRPYSRRSRSRPLVRAVGIEKAVIDRTDRLIPVTCMEVEDENDDEDENDRGSGGGELSSTIAGIVRLKAIDQSGSALLQHARAFQYRGSCLLLSPIVLVLGFWF